MTKLSNRLLGFTLTLLFLSLTACYSSPSPICSFSCGPEGLCPNNYRCVNQVCLRNDIPEEQVCEWGKPDASPVRRDAGTTVIDSALPEVDAASEVSDAAPESDSQDTGDE